MRNKKPNALAIRDRIVSRLQEIGVPPTDPVFPALAAIGPDTEDSEIDGVFEQAGEASTHTNPDGFWDDSIDVLANEFSSR